MELPLLDNFFSHPVFAFEVEKVKAIYNDLQNEIHRIECLLWPPQWVKNIQEYYEHADQLQGRIDAINAQLEVQKTRSFEVIRYIMKNSEELKDKYDYFEDVIDDFIKLKIWRHSTINL